METVVIPSKIKLRGLVKTLKHSVFEGKAITHYSDGAICFLKKIGIEWSK